MQAEAVTSRWSGDNMTSKIMRMWHPRAKAMGHIYSLVGYLLSPNPIIMKHAQAHKNEHHDEAAAKLISRLILPDFGLVGEARTMKRADLVNTFWEEYSDFTLHIGKFSSPDMWIIAAKPKQLAHMWHKTYSLTRTEVLGKLACLTTSKNLGIGSAERHWKIVKATKAGQRARLGTEKAKKSALIYGAAMQQRSRHRENKLRIAGKLWEDDDFETLKLDFYCEEIVQAAVTLPQAPARIFRAWEEGWEKVTVGPGGDDRLEARLVAKYGGLRWLDRDNGFRLCVAHPSSMFFEKRRGNNKYLIFATYARYDLDKPLEQQKDKFDGWPKTNIDFYDEVVDYYKDIPEVKCYEEVGDADSDSDFSDDDGGD